MIRFSHEQLNQIKAAALTAYPAECCGLLVGQGSEISRVVPSVNLLGGQQNDRFEIDPQIRIDLERALRGSEENLIGHYHSHPDHAALPSQTDLERVYEPDLLWVIVAVSASDVNDVKAHRFDKAKQSFTEIPLEVI